MTAGADRDTMVDHKPLILVTGATGYIGGRLLKALEAGGHQVHCLVRPGRAAGFSSRAGSALEGDLLPVHCVAEPERCRRAPGCAAREVWCEIHAAVDAILSRITLAELAAREEVLEACGAASYDI